MSGTVTLVVRPDEAREILYAIRFRAAYLESEGRSLKLIRSVERKVETMLEREHVRGGV